MTLLNRKAAILLGLFALCGCASSDSPCDSGYLMPSKIDSANFQCRLQPADTVVPETTVTQPPVIDSDYINNDNAHLEDETSSIKHTSSTVQICVSAVVAPTNNH